MKRWGVLGLAVLAAACGGEGDQDVSAQAHLCPGVVAGEVPGAEPSQSVLPGQEPASDGRQRFLIRYRDGERVSASRVSALGGRVLRVFRYTPAMAASLTEEERATLAEDPSVEFIEPDSQRRASGLTLGEPQPLRTLVQEGSAGEYTQGLHMVEAPWVWDGNRDGKLDSDKPHGEGIKVCVLDSGIDLDHPELRDAIVGRHDFVDGDDLPWDRSKEGWGEGHGTHVAGIIAAQLGSGARNVSPDMDRAGVAGVAPGAGLLIARVLNTQGVAWSSDILEALEWCQLEGAKIASLSLGGSNDGRLERETFQAVADKGMLVVAAAGNSGGPMDFPAAYPSVLAVGAVDQSMRRAPFSARGANLSLMAPGVEVLSTFPQQQGTMSQVELGDIPYASHPIALTPAGKLVGRLVDCGEGDSLGSCTLSSCDGFVAYVRRNYRVPLQLQISNVMRQGAQAVIVRDMPSDDELADLSMGKKGTWAPAALVSHETGEAMRRMMGFTAHVTLHQTDYARASGTSMAAPHVSGVAAIVWSKRPTLTAAQVRSLLESTAKDLGAPGKDRESGHGLVQAQAAIDALAALP
jgi:subtilisin family serine protease